VTVFPKKKALLLLLSWRRSEEDRTVLESDMSSRKNILAKKDRERKDKVSVNRWDGRRE
jgi:hypothetical protein